jgi:Spy/CpxP family protein refolding chaperone
MRNVVLGGLVLLGCCSFAVAQPGGFGRGPGGPGGPGGPFGGMGMLLQAEEVQSELKLDDAQKEELQTLASDMRDEIGGEMREMFQGMRDLSDEEREEKFAEIRTRMDEIRKDIEGRVQGVLKPEQFDRLKQLELQQRMRQGGGGAGAALLDGELAEKLGITEEQKEQMRTKAEEARAEMTEKMNAARKEAEAKVLAVLTPAQREQLTALMGTDFALPEPQFGRGFGGRGRFGGRRGGGQPGGGEARPDLEL